MITLAAGFKLAELGLGALAGVAAVASKGVQISETLKESKEHKSEEKQEDK